MQMRVLIIEDERKVADFISRGLRAERFAVDVACDGLGGGEMASSVDYDLLILDLMLPGLGGAELFRRLRQKGKPVAVPVLFPDSRFPPDRGPGLSAPARSVWAPAPQHPRLSTYEH
jgi:two-component system, OmpR family, response regulator MprA